MAEDDRRAAALAALDQALAGTVLTPMEQVSLLRLRARDATTIGVVARLLQAARSAEATASAARRPHPDNGTWPGPAVPTDPTSFRVELGRRLVELRGRHGLSQAQLAERAGVSRNFLGAVERGSQNLDAWRLRRHAEALPIPCGVLIGEIPAKPAADLAAGK